MLSRRTLFAVLSVTVVGIGAAVLQSRADDEEPIKGLGLTSLDAGLDFISMPKQQLEKVYVDIQFKIAVNLSEEELRTRIAAAQQELQKSAYEKELQRIRGELEQLKAKYPEMDKADRAQRAINVLDDVQRRPIESEVPVPARRSPVLRDSQTTHSGDDV
jgi:hypothetical protein